MKPNSGKYNYDELLKSRNEIMKRCENQNKIMVSSNLSYESNQSIDGFQRSQFIQQREADKMLIKNMNGRNIPNGANKFNDRASRISPSPSLTQKSKFPQMANRKSTTNLLPAKSKKPKFILKKSENEQR